MKKMTYFLRLNDVTSFPSLLLKERVFFIHDRNYFKKIVFAAIRIIES